MTRDSLAQRVTAGSWYEQVSIQDGEEETVSSASEYKYINQPGKIGKLTLKNRIVRMGASPSAGKFDLPDYTMPDWMVDFYESLAEGGTALVTVAGGHIRVAPLETPVDFRIEPDDCIPDLARVPEAIHRYGALAFMQLMTPYPCPYGSSDPESLASSDLSKEELEKLMPVMRPTRAMTHDEIHTLVRRYGEVALRMKKAGFDGVEVNSAHTHGLNTFVSPAWNKRTDEYGGDAHGRTRIVREIIREIKRVCGEDYTVTNLISIMEYGTEGGTTIKDAIEVAKELEAAGSDAIHCRMEMAFAPVEGAHSFMSYECPDVMLYPNLVDEDLSEFGIDNSYGNGIAAWSLGAGEIKKHVNIPIICVGRMDADVAEKLIGEGKIDFANINRRTMADPDYVNKILSGHKEDVRPCVGCFTCYEMEQSHQIVWCMVNGGFLGGKEYRTITPAEKKKKVLVIGSGAAGLESARVLALRGHDVILCEKDKKIGGTLPMAAMIKDFHEDFLGFSNWQVRQVEKMSNIDIRTGVEVDAEYVRELDPDAVIVAVGGAEKDVVIPGIDNKLVMTGEELHKQLKRALKLFSVESIGKLSKLYLPLGKRVVVLGGSIHGAQTALFLMKRGREVVIVEESDEIGAGMIDIAVRSNLLRYFKEKEIEIHTNAKVKEITKKGLWIVDADGNEEFIKADNIVTALPMDTNLDLYEEIKEFVPEVHAIGDCNPLVIDEPFPQPMIQTITTPRRWPSYTTTAIREAYRIAREI